MRLNDRVEKLTRIGFTSLLKSVKSCADGTRKCNDFMIVHVSLVSVYSNEVNTLHTKIDVARYREHNLYYLLHQGSDEDIKWEVCEARAHCDQFNSNMEYSIWILGVGA